MAREEAIYPDRLLETLREAVATRSRLSLDDIDAASLLAVIDRLQEEQTAFAQERLTPRTYMRLVDWLSEDPICPAAIAFTAGLERQIAYALEMIVLPEVISLRLRLANARKEAFRDAVIEWKKPWGLAQEPFIDRLLRLAE